MIHHQILHTNILSIIWQTVKRITNEILAVKGSFVFSVLQEMIDEADRDGDGEINEAEFLRIMKKTSLY